MGNWGRTPRDSLEGDPVETFTTFHRSLPRNAKVVPWKVLADWHNTSAWIPNQSSYELVSAALRDVPGSLPHGTERLLALAAARPLSSWVPFTTSVMSQNPLRVAVSFSGDLDNLGPRVYRYTFEVQR